MYIPVDYVSNESRVSLHSGERRGGGRAKVGSHWEEENKTQQAQEIGLHV